MRGRLKSMSEGQAVGRHTQAGSVPREEERPSDYIYRVSEIMKPYTGGISTLGILTSTSCLLNTAQKNEREAMSCIRDGTPATSHAYPSYRIVRLEHSLCTSVDLGIAPFGAVSIVRIVRTLPI